MKNILMNVEMTKAILDGRKVQTRRIIKNTSYGWTPRNFCEIHKMKDGEFVLKNGEPIIIGNGVCNDDGDEGYMPKYQIGETISVREPARVVNSQDDKFMFCEYLADGQEIKMQYPERFTNPLPKWVSNCQGIPNGCIKEMARIFLKITNVRVERLQDMTLPDMQSEGCPYGSEIGFHPVRISLVQNWWIDLWNKTAPKGYKYLDNPYVFVYEFERIEK